MIYFTNSSLAIPHMTFIGRWDPFHQGHEELINKKRLSNPDLPIMIQVRMTDDDFYSPGARAEFIKIWMLEKNIEGTIVLIPNVEGIYWGRTVGYKLEEIDVDVEIKNISATSIRNDIKEANGNWKHNIASNGAIKLLNPKVSKIVESGLVVWLTGCPSAGKTTLSKLLYKKTKQAFPLLKIQSLDGDVMRSSPISKNAGFSIKDREEHIHKMGYLSKLFADHGIMVIASFISPSKKSREKNKKLIGKSRFVEIYVKSDLENRMQRDKKGLYKKALQGKIKNLTGFNATYEEPINPDVICDTDFESEEESAQKVFNYIFS